MWKRVWGGAHGEKEDLWVTRNGNCGNFRQTRIIANQHNRKAKDQAIPDHNRKSNQSHWWKACRQVNKEGTDQQVRAAFIIICKKNQTRQTCLSVEAHASHPQTDQTNNLRNCCEYVFLVADGFDGRNYVHCAFLLSRRQESKCEFPYVRNRHC